MIPRARFAQARTWPVYIIDQTYTPQQLVEWKRARLINQGLSPATALAQAPDVVLGTSNDTAEVERVLGYANSRAFRHRGTDWLVRVDFGPTQLFCEDPIELDDHYNLLLAGAGTDRVTLGPDGQGGYGDPSAANTEALGLADDTTYRNNALWIFNGGERLMFAKNFRISGPHPDTGRAKSLNYVLEACHGVWVQSVGENLPPGEGWGLWLNETNIDHVWGDHLSTTPYVPYGANTVRLWVNGGVWDRNGREAVLLNGVDEFRWFDTEVKRPASQIVHGETGQGQSDPTTQHDIVIRGINVSTAGGGDMVHITGGYRIDGFELTDCKRPNDAMIVWIDPTLRIDGEARIKHVRICRNSHGVASDGPDIVTMRHVDDVLIEDNSGPLRSIRTLLEQLDFTDCQDVVVGDNDYWGYKP